MYVPTFSDGYYREIIFEMTLFKFVDSKAFRFIIL